MELLQRFQDRAISIIDTARIKDDWSKNFLQVKQLITFDRSVMTYKIMNRYVQKTFGINFNEDLITLTIILDFVRTFKFQSIIWNILKRDFLTQL